MRIDRKDEDYEPDLPPIDAPHLIGYLWEVGPAMPGGMGPAPVSFSEIQAWEASTGIELQPWEARMLRRLSLDYISESHKAEKADCPAPWMPELPDRAVVVRKVQSAFSLLMRKR